MEFKKSPPASLLGYPRSDSMESIKRAETKTEKKLPYPTRMQTRDPLHSRSSHQCARKFQNKLHKKIENISSTCQSTMPYGITHQYPNQLSSLQISCSTNYRVRRACMVLQIACKKLLDILDVLQAKVCCWLPKSAGTTWNILIWLCETKETLRVRIASIPVHAL